MARTKASRNVAPFKLRSGNSPLPLFGGLGQTLKRGFNNLIGKGPGGPGGPGGGLKEKIDEIHAATAGKGGENGGIAGVGAKVGSNLQDAIAAAGGSTDPAVIAEQIKKKAKTGGVEGSGSATAEEILNV